MQFFPVTPNVALKQHTIVVWSPPAHGNVGQMAVDSLIKQQGMKKTIAYRGCIESPLLMPMTGYQIGPDGNRMLAKPLEGNLTLFATPAATNFLS